MSASQCTPLDANTLCGPSFSGYPIMRQTLSEFNDDLQSRMNQDDIADNYFSSYGCKFNNTKNEVIKLRYVGSIRCVLQVYYSVTVGKCKPPEGFLPQGPVLCEPACRAAADSLIDLFVNSPHACPYMETSSEQFDLRTRVINSYNEACDRAKDATRIECWKGLPSELNLCGFRDAGFANAYCLKNSTDPCCASIPKLISSFTGAGNTGTRDTSSSVNFVAVIASVSAVIVAVGLATIGFLFYRFKTGRFAFKSSKNDLFISKDAEDSALMTSTGNITFLTDQTQQLVDVNATQSNRHLSELSSVSSPMSSRSFVLVAPASPVAQALTSMPQQNFG